MAKETPHIEITDMYSFRPFQAKGITERMSANDNPLQNTTSKR